MRLGAGHRVLRAVAAPARARGLGRLLGRVGGRLRGGGGRLGARVGRRAGRGADLVAHGAVRDERAAARVEALLVHLVAGDVQVHLARDVHRVDGEPGAGEAREGDVEVDGQLLAARGVDAQLVRRAHAQEEVQLREEEERHDGGGGERDRAAGGGALEELGSLVARLGEGVEGAEAVGPAGRGAGLGAEGHRAGARARAAAAGAAARRGAREARRGARLGASGARPRGRRRRASTSGVRGAGAAVKPPASTRAN